MSISLSGMDQKVSGSVVEINVSCDHPLVELANTLDLEKISALAMADLKETTAKGFWWLGRKLRLRVHLGIFILQSLLNKTDRQMEEEVKHNASYRVFCGSGIVAGWICPDHTKIEEFRNRLKPETQRQIGISVVQSAEAAGFADPSWAEIDSTVQEANMAYPSDAHLMVKLAVGCRKVVEFFKSQGKRPGKISVALSEVKKRACAYFFVTKQAGIEEKKKRFKELFKVVKKQTRAAIAYCEARSYKELDSLPWNICRKVKQIAEQATKYLKHVSYFIRTQTMKKGKILSFHLSEVVCIKKGKVGKDKQFGRTFQLMRIGGNFLVPLPTHNIRNEDKSAIVPMLEEHKNIFGQGRLKSMGSDKGYYSRHNIAAAKNAGVQEIGIQYPANLKNPPTDLSDAKRIELRNRRAGIEPLIAHAKRKGLERSRMKSDLATQASGFRSVLAFNLQQTMRHQNLRNAERKRATA